MKSISIETIKTIDYSKYAPLFALIILVILSAVASEHFLKFRNITNILRQVSYTGTIALGMTFVIVAAGIDLSVGSMVALVGVLAIYLMNYLGTSVFAVVTAVFVAILAGSLCGALNGLIVTRGKIAAFIATLATMSIFRSLTLYISEAGEVISHNDIYPEIGGGPFSGTRRIFPFSSEQHRVWQTRVCGRCQPTGGNLFRHQSSLGYIHDLCDQRFYRRRHRHSAVFKIKLGKPRRRRHILRTRCDRGGGHRRYALIGG